MIQWSASSANIRIDGTALPGKAQNSYESDVYVKLSMISTTETGRAVFRAIHSAGVARGKYISIVPFLDDDQDDAYASPKGGAAEGRDAAPQGVVPYLGGPDDVKTYDDEREVKQFFEGTGLGSDVEIYYNPHPPASGPPSTCPRDGRKWKGGCPQYEGADHGKDDQLLHELVHAVRELRGEFNQIPTWDKDWMNEEEFFAVLVSNIYLSEQGKKNLRGNYLGFGLLPAPLSTAEGFLGKDASLPSRDHLEHRRLVSKLVCEDYGLCADLCRILRAEFNPIREYMRHAEFYPLDGRKTNGSRRR
jgi:hypothetical protein